MSEFSDGYLAGIFDGEGCVSASIKGPPYLSAAIEVVVTMTDVQPVKMFHDRFGGQFRQLPIPPNGLKIPYKWSVTSGTAIPALEFLSENCVVKRRVAELGLELAVLVSSKSRVRLEEADRIKRADIVREIRKIVDSPKPLNEELVKLYIAKETKNETRVENSIGEKFRSVSAAAAAYGVDRGYIYRSIKGFGHRGLDPFNGITWRLAS